MFRLARYVRVASLGDDLRVGRGDSGELFENQSRRFKTSEQTEVVAEHLNRVETVFWEFINFANRSDERFFQTSQLADFDCAGRIVYAGYVETFFLQVKRVSSRAAADV